MKRAISHSEISRALDCQASWDFSYGGHLAGHALKTKQPHLRLREGRAWGRAVAAFHGAAGSTLSNPGGDPVPRGGVGRFDSGFVGSASSQPLHKRYAHALNHLHAALQEDADQLREHGFYDETEHHDMAQRLADILWHYAATTEPLTITDPEFELQVPIPSRTGRRASSRYVFHGFLDGLGSDVYGQHLFIVEYKLRQRLTDLAQIVLGRQYRRYAWATEQQLGVRIGGVIVDERLNEAPKPPRLVKGRKKGEGLVPSHAKDQLTTPDLYRATCEEFGVPFDADTAEALGQRRWQTRHVVMFRRAEIEEAGRELVSAAQLIGQLDTGALWPVRNPDPRRCPGCAFREICPDPSDTELIDLTFERVVPKRDRVDEPLLEGSPA